MLRDAAALHQHDEHVADVDWLTRELFAAPLTPDASFAYDSSVAAASVVCVCVCVIFQVKPRAMFKIQSRLVRSNTNHNCR